MDANADMRALAELAPGGTVEVERQTTEEIVVYLTGPATYQPPAGFEAAGSEWNGKAGAESESREWYRRVQP